jgi:DNA adenine methylase
MCGDIVYGDALPDHLNVSRVLLNAGRSSQATLNGKVAVTVESLYLSQDIPGDNSIYTGKNQPAQLLSA